MHITFETKALRAVGFQNLAQTPRVLSDELLARLNFGEKSRGVELALTAYRSPANGDVLIIAEGEGYFKRFVLHADNQLSVGLSSEDQKTFETELVFHDIKKDKKKLELELENMKNELQYWKDHKKEKIEELRRNGPHKDGLDNPINGSEAYKLLFSEMKETARTLEKNLNLDIKAADTRTIKLP